MAWYCIYLAFRFSGWLTDWLAGSLSGWQTDWLDDWLTNWLASRMTVWLLTYFSYLLFDLSTVRRSLVRYVRNMPKIKSSCQNWFYCFFDFIRGQISQKYWGSIFPAPQPRFQNGRHRNHIFGYNLGPSIARVTILMSIPMFLGTRNPIVPIKNVDVS